MTTTQIEHGPFASPTPAFWPNGPQFLCVANATERISLVRKSTDPEWLQAVVDLPHSQQSVKFAAELRLRQVNKAIKNLVAQARS